jgi:hypothetical protein
MSTLAFRGGSIPIALAAIAVGLLAPTPTAVAATSVQAAAAAFGIDSYSVVELPSGGDLAGALTGATRAASGGVPTLLHLSAGQLNVRTTVRPGNNVYLVAEPDTKIVWQGTAGQPLLRFTSGSAGVYGGVWDGGLRKGSSVIAVNGAAVQLSSVTVTRGGNHGIGAYAGSRVTLRNVTATANKVDGVHVEGKLSVLDASGLVSRLNVRNGVQVSDKASGTINASTLDSNGQGVHGTTTGKTGHGLGVASASVTVSDSSLSDNKVCGISLSGSASAIVSGSHLDRNGRHGLGTTAGTSATVSQSSADKNGYNGILASGSGTKVSLQGVRITSAKKIGLSVPSGGSASISGVTISSSGTQNVSASSRGTLSVLDGNTITAAKAHGIAISGKSKITVTGAGNVVAANRKFGLLLTNSGTVGTIRSAISFQGNGTNARVISKAKLTSVPCLFSGTGGTKITTGSGGKVTILR